MYCSKHWHWTSCRGIWRVFHPAKVTGMIEPSLAPHLKGAFLFKWNWQYFGRGLEVLFLDLVGKEEVSPKQLWVSCLPSRTPGGQTASGLTLGKSHSKGAGPGEELGCLSPSRNKSFKHSQWQAIPGLKTANLASSSFREIGVSQIHHCLWSQGAFAGLLRRKWTRHYY